MRWGLSILLGAPSGIVYYLFLLEHTPLSGVKSVISLLYLSMLFSGLVYLLLFIFILPRLSKYSPRAKLPWLIGSLLAGIWLAIAIPLPIPAIFPMTHNLEVIATGQKDPRSQGSEVWLTGLYLPDGSKVDVNNFTLGEGWIVRDGVPVSYQYQPAVLSWQGAVDGNLRLTLVAHPWSGFVQIVLDGRSQELNLYNDPGTSKEISFQLSTPPHWYYYLLIYFGFGVIFMMLLSCFMIVFYKKIDRKRQLSKKSSIKLGIIPSRWKWLLFALPLFLVCFFYLLIYWPGLMSPDSLDQWNQLSTGIFNDWHPAFHTFFEWALTRLWGSPASIALFQIFAMGSLVGWGLAEFEKMGTPSWFYQIFR
jgi:hypothetical protein